MQTKPRKQYNKNYRYVILLAAIFLLIVVTYLILKPNNKEEITKIDNPLPFKTIYDFSDNPLKEVDVSLANGQSFTLFNNDGKLSFKDNEQQYVFVDDDSNASILNFLTKISVEDTVSEDGVVEPEMGLEPYILKVDAEYKDGKTLSLLCGNQIPLTSYLYFKIENEKGIYAISPGFFEVFNLQTDRLRNFDKLPIERNLINKIIYQKAGGEVFKIDILAVEKERIYGNLIGEYTYPANPVMLNNLCKSFSDIVPGAYVKQFEEGDMEKYGFASNVSTKITINQNAAYKIDGDETIIVDKSEITIIFGFDFEEHQKYMLYDDVIYRVSTILIAPIIQGDFESLISMEPFTLSLDDLSNISNIIDDFDGLTNTWNVMVNNNTEEISISKNDANFNLEDFKEIIKSLVTKSVNIKLDKFLNSFSEKPLRKITINYLNGQKHVVEFYHKDNYHDIVSVNGVAAYAWPKEYTNTVLPR